MPQEKRFGSPQRLWFALDHHSQIGQVATSDRIADDFVGERAGRSWHFWETPGEQTYPTPQGYPFIA